MTFDLNRLDDMDDVEEALDEYQDELFKLFADSPEGQACAQADPGMGFWVTRLIDYGYSFTGVTVPQMAASDLEELLTEVFPRKISLAAPDHADDAIPELIAFWEYLKRAYQLANADEILSYLRSVRPEAFRTWMNDPSRFGMAKSFFMMGQAAGFDMTDEKESAAFVNLYNASLPLPGRSDLSLMSGLSRLLETGGHQKKDAAKAKHRRKIAKASRKRNRQRK
jgi:hypothetical protein